MKKKSRGKKSPNQSTEQTQRRDRKACPQKRPISRASLMFNLGQSLAKNEPARLADVERWLATDAPPMRLGDVGLSPAERDQAALYRVVAEFVRKQAFFRPAPNTTWRDYAAAALQSALTESYRLLNELADDDLQAVSTLLDLVVAGTKTLHRIAKVRPQSIQAVTSKALLFPYLASGISRLRDKETEVREWIKPLQLSSAVSFSAEAIERWPADDVVNRVTDHLLSRLEYERNSHGEWRPDTQDKEPKPWQAKAHNLPIFSVGSFPDWSAAAWNLLLDECNGRPELDKDLRRIGSHRGTTTGLIRQGIREAIQKRIRARAIPEKVS